MTFELAIQLIGIAVLVPPLAIAALWGLVLLADYMEWR